VVLSSLANDTGSRTVERRRDGSGIGSGAAVCSVSGARAAGSKLGVSGARVSWA